MERAEYPISAREVLGHSRSSDQGGFWASPVEILVFASPTGYMLTSSGFPLLNSGIFYKFL